MSRKRQNAIFDHQGKPSAPLTWKGRVTSHQRIIQIIIEQIAGAHAVPLQLPYPHDLRASRVADFLLKNPSESKTLEELCAEAGGSKRTIERAFIDGTNMTFGKWRQQLRLLHAIRLIASGEKITMAALEVG